MAKQVKGFLAADGKFFDTEAECRRHEFEQAIASSCESHNINATNFFMLLREWHDLIEGWYNADSKCKERESTATGRPIEFEAELPSAEDDNEDAPIGDKDAPAFLEQSFRRRI